MRTGSRPPLTVLRLPLALSGRRLVEQLEPLLERWRLGRSRGVPLDHTNRLSGRQPVQIVSWTDFVTLGDRLRQCQLEFAGNFGHNQKYTKDYVLVQSLFPGVISPYLASHIPGH